MLRTQTHSHVQAATKPARLLSRSTCIFQRMIAWIKHLCSGENSAPTQIPLPLKSELVTLQERRERQEREYRLWLSLFKQGFSPKEVDHLLKLRALYQQRGSD